jgi:hypothetical protein
MRELLRTNNLVRLSYLEALLLAEGIQPFIMDANMSSLEGGVIAIPRRLMVREEELNAARGLLLDAGEELG